MKKRTSDLERINKELSEKNEDLERFYDTSVDRELRMRELRDRIEELEEEKEGKRK